MNCNSPAVWWGFFAPWPSAWPRRGPDLPLGQVFSVFFGDPPVDFPVPANIVVMFSGGSIYPKYT
jgi:hypothetical protein